MKSNEQSKLETQELIQTIFEQTRTDMYRLIAPLLLHSPDKSFAELVDDAITLMSNIDSGIEEVVIDRLDQMGLIEAPKEKTVKKKTSKTKKAQGKKGTLKKAGK